jgi:cyclohexanone monooxygenase
MRRTVWGSGCASWYQNEHGRNIAMWPDYTLAYRRQTRHFDTADYVIGRRPSKPARTASTA